MSGNWKPIINKPHPAADDTSSKRSTPEIRYQPIAPLHDPSQVNYVPEGRRLVRACDECRRKKIKCCTIANSTSCKNCISYKKGCTYNTSIKKRGPPRGYINVLENRLKRIEELIDNIKSESKDKSQQTTETSTQPIKKVKTVDTRTEPDDTNDMIESIRQSHLTTEGRFISNNNVSCIFKKMNLLDEKTLSQYGIAIQHDQNNDYFHIKKKVSPKDHRSDQVKQLIELGFMKPHETVSNIDDWVWKVSGIDKQLGDRLLKIYFAYIHPLLPVVNKTSFLEEYRGIQSSFPAGPLLNAMYGAAVRYIDNCKKFGDSERLDGGKPWDLPENLSHRLFSTLIVFIKGKYAPCLSSIQAIVIGHNHSVSFENWSSGWLLNCIAVRMSQDIGLHRSSDGWKISQQEKETRRMVWWSVYILDRWFSSGTGRPLTAFDEDCDELYPSENVSMDNIMDTMTKTDQHLPRYPSLDESVAARVTESSIPMNQPFLHLLKLSEILGRILQGLYTPQAKKHSAIHGSDAIVAYLDNALSNWKNSLPPLLNLSSAGRQSLLAQDHVPLLSMSGLLCLSYCTLLILLHRPFITKDDTLAKDSVKGTEKHASQSALDTCTQAAIRITEVSENMHYRDFLLVSWGFALYPVFTASLIHIHNCFNSDPKVSDIAKSNLVRSFAVVDKLGMLSPMAIGMGTVLKRVVSLSSLFVDDPEFLEKLNISKSTQEKESERSESHDSSGHQDIKHNTKDSLPNGSQHWFPDKVNITLKDDSLDPYSPSLNDGSWINQLCAPTQAKFDVKVNISGISTTPINSNVQATKHYAQPTIGGFNMRPYGHNVMNPSVTAQPIVTPTTSFPYPNPGYQQDPMQFGPSNLFDFEDFMFPQFYSTPGLNTQADMMSTHLSFSCAPPAPHMMPMRNEDPEAHLRNIPDNPFWSVPSSMEMDDWQAYLLPFQQQWERQQQQQQQQQ